MNECIFCKISAGDIPTPRIYENDYAFVIDDINPVAKTHFLVITKKHYPNISSIDYNDLGVLRGIHEAICEAVRIKQIETSGFRLISNCGEDSCQTVPHLHYHIVGGEKLSMRIV